MMMMIWIMMMMKIVIVNMKMTMIGTIMMIMMMMIQFAKVSASDTVSEGGNEQTTRGNLTIEVNFLSFFIVNTSYHYYCKHFLPLLL